MADGTKYEVVNKRKNFQFTNDCDVAFMFLFWILYDFKSKNFRFFMIFGNQGVTPFFSNNRGICYRTY